MQLTQEAKIASDFLYIRAIFAVVGFVSALNPRLERGFRRAYSYVQNRQTLFQQTGDALGKTCGKEC